MAETLTVDNQSEAEVMADAGELTAEEQDSLALGESLVEQQEGLLAGKYKDAEALEAGYKELEAKLGRRDEDEDTEVADSEDTQTEAFQTTPATDLITAASDEYWNNGEQLSQETIEKFSSMSSRDLVDAYVAMSQADPNYGPPPGDLSDADVNAVQNAAGGEAQYKTMTQWASDNLAKQDVQAFDNIINSGNLQAIQLAVAGLKSTYEQANGYEGRMLSGKPPRSSGEVFRSQAELVAAMSDRRYDNDPAYRQDIMEKLDRSNIDF